MEVKWQCSTKSYWSSWGERFRRGKNRKIEKSDFFFLKLVFRCLVWWSLLLARQTWLNAIVVFELFLSQRFKFRTNCAAAISQVHSCKDKSGTKLGRSPKSSLLFLFLFSTQNLHFYWTILSSLPRSGGLISPVIAPKQLSGSMSGI